MLDKMINELLLYSDGFSDLSWTIFSTTALTDKYNSGKTREYLSVNKGELVIGLE